MSASCCTLIFCLLICLLGSQRILVLGQMTVADYCNTFPSMTINVTQFMGEWYEVARLPANNMSCVQTNLSINAQQDALNVNTSFSYESDEPWNKYDMIGAVSLPNLTPLSLYNFSYTLGNVSLPYSWYKIVTTDYTNFSFICGYSNATGTIDTFALVLSRNQTSLSQEASGLITSLQMPMIIQNSTCSTNPNSSSTPSPTTASPTSPSPTSPGSGSTLSFSILYPLVAFIALRFLFV
ncbi:uncharacterized protein LOC115623505 [Scaptodrosophila lebanonensis]|uniref:Uncharacterized protein LOC115623505 n=1 Tax=Drosophila lebanonensis TaxID=7225 RepID=A0A6J2TF53_DROLE|nr:uncharacterized protein LOC115623505 [Scaptodrosophila lebanonensis]